MGNKTSTQAGVLKEQSKTQKEFRNNGQKQRRKQKLQHKLKLLRNGSSSSIKISNDKNAGGKDVVDGAKGPPAPSSNDKSRIVNEYIRQNHSSNTRRPNTPLLEPKIEENVSDIEEPDVQEEEEGGDDDNQSFEEEEEAPTLTEYLSKREIATSPTATDSNCSYDRSFGMDSYDSSSSPQKHFVFDTSALNGSPISAVNSPHSETNEHNDHHDDYHENSQRKLPSSRLFAIQESSSAADNSSRSPETSIHQNNVNTITTGAPTAVAPSGDDNFDNDDNNNYYNDDDLEDNDQFSDASSQPESREIFHGIDANSIDGSDLLSQGSCSEFDNMSRGVVSIAEKSLSSIPSIIMKNKQYTRDKMKTNNDQQHHHNDENNDIAPMQEHSNRSQNFSSSRSVISCSELSIHSRRTKVKRSRSDSTSPKNTSTRPNATNAFETLPRHLIKTGLLRQTAATLRDERFVKRRIEKLGCEYASKIHASDFELLQKRDIKNAEKREREREDGGLEAELPSAQSFPDGDDFFSVMMDSFDMFLKCILEMCDVGLQGNSIFEVEEGCDDLLEEDEEGVEENSDDEEESDIVDDEEENDVLEMGQKQVEPKIPSEDGGKAIFILGKFLQNKGWIDDAKYYFRHALYLCLLECDVDEPRLMDEAEDCEGLFYDDIATRGTMDASKTHEILGIILIKMGDVHGKNSEVNDALRAYRASQIFWSTYLTNHKVSNEGNDGDKVDDFDELTDYTASVEGLALTHNRIGGVYTSKGDLVSALESFHEALELQIDALGDDHLEVAKTLHNIGVCHRHNDEWDEALEYYTRAHIIFKKVLGKNHLDTARTLHNIGGVYRRKKMYPEALECFKQVLFTRRKLLGDDHPSVSIALVSIAASLRRSGRKEEANKFYAAAVR